MTNKIHSSTLENVSVFALLALALGAPACSTHLDDGKSGETHFLCKTDTDCSRHFGNDDYQCGEENFCTPRLDGGPSGAGGGDGTGGIGESGGTGAGGENRGTGAGGENSGGAGGGINGGSGGACVCTTQGCGPGTRSVTTPGECCPHCEPCGVVNCPQLSCPPGETPVTPPGECCPTMCACMSGVRPEACDENDLPRCAPNWAEALARYSGLWCAAGQVSLARCDPYDAIVSTDMNGDTWYFYDQSGTMVGSSGSNSMGEYCTAYTPSFAPPSGCAAVNAPCAPADAGGGLCGNGVVDVGEECDPAAPMVTCNVVTMGAKPYGLVKCTSMCLFNTSGCRAP